MCARRRKTPERHGKSVRRLSKQPCQVAISMTPSPIDHSRVNVAMVTRNPALTTANAGHRPCLLSRHERPDADTQPTGDGAWAASRPDWLAECLKRPRGPWTMPGGCEAGRMSRAATMQSCWARSNAGWRGANHGPAHFGKVFHAETHDCRTKCVNGSPTHLNSGAIRA